MTKFVDDSISVDTTIGGDDWLISDAKVVLSRNRAPNYVRIKKMAPGPETTFKNVNNLLGKKFSLSVDTELTEYRNAPGEFTSTLFEGKVANITSRGTGVFEATIYDPTQQALNGSPNGGSIMNKEISLSTPELNFNKYMFGDAPYSAVSSTNQMPKKMMEQKASVVLTEVLDKAGIDGDREIQLTEGGKTVGGPRGSFVGAKNTKIRVDVKKITVGKALERLTNATKSFWWFDRTGTFYFGVPDANVHTPELITGNSAGVTTPPYQSIIVIGSAIKSKNGVERAHLNVGEPLVVGGNIVLGGNGEPQLNTQSLQYGDINGLVSPTFVHKNRELITEEQARNALEKLAQDLGEQYASGTLTTVGFPEPEIFDVIVLPHANENKKSKGNYNPRQPMGGSIFGLYKIEHMLNPSDGYKTKMHVAGMSGPASVLVDPNQFVKDPASTFREEDAGLAETIGSVTRDRGSASSEPDEGGFNSDNRNDRIDSDDDVPIGL